MGAAGSGLGRKFVFDEKTISKIRVWCSLGADWHRIAEALRFKNDTPLRAFLRENPDFKDEMDQLQFEANRKLEVIFLEKMKQESRWR